MINCVLHVERVYLHIARPRMLKFGWLDNNFGQTPLVDKVS